MIVLQQQSDLMLIPFHRNTILLILSFYLLILAKTTLTQSLRHDNHLQQGATSLPLNFNFKIDISSMSRMEDPNNESLSFLMEEEYIGTYQNIDKTSILDYISSESGTAQATLYKNQFGTSIYEIDTFQMVLFDPIYHDQRAIKVQVELQKMVNKNQWNGTNANILVGKFWKQRSDGDKNISNVNYTIRVLNIDNKNPKEVIMEIQFNGPDFKFKANLNYDDARLSAMGYSLYTAAAVLVQIVCAYLLVKKIDVNNPGLVNKMSLTTVAICNIQDFYLTMIHIQYIMTSGSSTYLFYVMPSLCYIMLFVVFDMKLLFLVWRSHYMRQIDNPQALRKKLTTFYIKFYVGLFVYLTMTYFFSFDVWMIIFQNLVMIPQIVYNARIGNNPGFQPLYVLGYMGARFLIPLYERGCPSNHFMLTPIVGLVIALFILYILQILILFLQHKLGPRFFIPKIFQPDYYNYNFKIRSSQENHDLQCSICLQHFFGDMDINSSELEQTMVKEKTVMRTPCNHYFHKQCLASWIDVKLQCPSCRAPLPPL